MRKIFAIAAVAAMSLSTAAFAQSAGAPGAAGASGTGLSGSNPGTAAGAPNNNMQPGNEAPVNGMSNEGRAAAPDSNTNMTAPNAMRSPGATVGHNPNDATRNNGQ